MNRRQWKKACKRAALEVERRRPGQYQFLPAEGNETVYAPRGYVSPYRGRLARSDQRYPDVPKGTPVVWLCSGYYEPEWDCYTALEILARIEDEDWWDSKSEAELNRMCTLEQQSFDSALDEACESLWFVLQQPEQVSQVAAVHQGAAAFLAG